MTFLRAVPATMAMKNPNTARGRQFADSAVREINALSSDPADDQQPDLPHTPDQPVHPQKPALTSSRLRTAGTLLGSAAVSARTLDVPASLMKAARGD